MNTIVEDAGEIVDRFLTVGRPILRDLLPKLRDSLMEVSEMSNRVLLGETEENYNIVVGVLRHFRFNAHLAQYGKDHNIEVGKRSWGKGHYFATTVKKTPYTEARLRFDGFDFGICRKSHYSDEKIHLSKLKVEDSSEINEFFGKVSHGGNLLVFLNLDVEDASIGAIRNAQLYFVCSNKQFYELVTIEHLQEILDHQTDTTPRKLKIVKKIIPKVIEIK